MFSGAAITFTNPIFNKDRTRSLTPPDNPISYITSAPKSGNVFIYSTQTGARSEINKLSLEKYFGFDVDVSGNPTTPTIQAEALPVNYYTIVGIPGVPLHILYDAFTKAGFGPTSISPDYTFKVPYIVDGELAIIKNAEREYNTLTIAPVAPGESNIDPVITVPNIATVQGGGLQGLLNMKVFGISAPLVFGGALMLLFILRR